MSVRIEVKYEAGHSYPESWSVIEDTYCPNCGKFSTLWSDDGPGDYYAGPHVVCIECGCAGESILGFMESDSWQDKQRINEIKMNA